MKRIQILQEILIALLIILFFYTGLSKLLEKPTFEFDLVNAPVINFLTPIILYVLPNVELLVALGLIHPRTRRIGLIVYLILMIIFTVYVGGILGFAKSKPCTCGGVLRSMTWPQHLVFNIAFTIITALTLYINKKVEAGARHLARN